MKNKTLSILAGVAVLAAAAAKILSGDYADINPTEIGLALAAIFAAFGFQRS